MAAPGLAAPGGVITGFSRSQTHHAKGFPLQIKILLSSVNVCQCPFLEKQPGRNPRPGANKPQKTK